MVKPAENQNIFRMIVYFLRKIRNEKKKKPYFSQAVMLFLSTLAFKMEMTTNVGRLTSVKEYLLWGQVQRKLTEHARTCGETYSFFDAVCELYAEGAASLGSEVPPVSFMDWDLRDLNGFYRLIDQVPVEMDTFYQAMRAGYSGPRAAEQLIGWDLAPGILARDQALGLHRHDCCELFYVLEGTLNLYCGDTARPLSQGSLGFIAPHLPHDIVAGPDCHTIYIPLAEQTVANTLHQLLRQSNVLSDFFQSGLEGTNTACLIFSVPATEYIRMLLRNIFHEYYAREQYGRTLCASYIEILLAKILQQCGESCIRYDWRASSMGTAPMLAVLQHIQDNYATTSLNETAALFHYDPSYLGKQIKAYTGKNYTALVREFRIDMAKRLLRGTDRTIGKIADQAGFDSLSYFSNAFRNATGMSPSEYRQQFVTS